MITMIAGAIFGAVGLPWIASTLGTISQQRGPIGKIWLAEVPEHWPRDEGPDRWFFFGFQSVGGVLESRTVSALPNVRASEFVTLTELRAGWPFSSLRSVHLAEVDQRGIVVYPMSSLSRTGIRIPGSQPVEASAIRGRTLPVLPLWGGLAGNATIWALLSAGLVESMIAFAARLRAESRSNRGLCPGCGYDLRGVPDCPECGYSVLHPAGASDKDRLGT